MPNELKGLKNRLTMNRSTVTRVVALAVLLLHGGTYAASTVFDGVFAARANATVAHVEGDGGPECVLVHDEATCQLCRAGTATGCARSAPVAIVALVRGGLPAGDAQYVRLSVTGDALHSRAPPIA